MKQRAQSQKQNKNDIIHTPKQVAQLMIGMCDIEPHHTLLDPCAGSNRVFVNNFPKENIKYYAEIEGIYTGRHFPGLVVNGDFLGIIAVPM